MKPYMEAMQSSDKYSERVVAVLARSLWGEAFVAGAGLATAALVASLPLAHEWRALAVAWILLVSLRAMRGLRPGVRLEVRLDGEVAIGGRAGRLRDGSFVAPFLAIVRWRPEGAWLDRACPVLPGMLPAGDFRRLRVLLRFARVGDKRDELRAE